MTEQQKADFQSELKALLAKHEIQISISYRANQGRSKPTLVAYHCASEDEIVFEDYYLDESNL